ncbi:hypothetical protein [Dyadobacter fermentans]|uniref:hypothetical protein n=1 Tax=Dyadobacter fermentans TaxID=94254 RepID=UPI001CBF55AC|nr:hypothetical protein [Dyadobacter fermentans]MBZ1362037.1 hypothetical protein [Dyadobacter fermentans]
MKAYILPLFLLLPFGAFAQTFFVEPTEKGFEKEVIQKLDFAGIKLVKEKTDADYLISTHYQKVKSINLGTYAAYMAVSDKQGFEVYRTKTKKKQANIYNGYQAVPAVLVLLTEKDLIPRLQKGL